MAKPWRWNNLKLATIPTVYLFLYFIAHGFNFLNTGIFWDDYSFYGAGTEVYYLEFASSSYYLFAWLLDLVLQPDVSYTLSVKHIYSLRLILMICYFIVPILFYYILKSARILSREQLTYAFLLMGILPVNFTRATLCVGHYAIHHVSFWIGLFLLTRGADRKNLALTLLSLPFFFASFFTPSILVFYAIVPLLYIRTLYATAPVKVRTLSKILKSSFPMLLLLIALPIVYWILYKTVFPPHGLYAGYNKVTLSALLKSPVGVLRSLYIFFSGLLFTNIVQRDLFNLSIGLGCIIYFWLSKVRKSAKESDQLLGWKSLFLIGVVLCSIAVFPYVVVGKTPWFYDMNSRHQLLLPTGLTFLCLSLLFYIPQNFRRIGFALMAAHFALINTFVYFSFHQDWFKQIALIENMKTTPELYTGRTFHFIDHTSRYNALGRGYRTYDYSGLMALAFGNEQRFGSSVLGDQRVFEPKFAKLWRLRDYVKGPTDYTVTIQEQTPDLMHSSFILKGIILQQTDPQRFRALVKNTLSLTATPVSKNSPNYK